jgi:D-alanyl-D-alanine carboxypeptidase (penicillin-binding protein 5/6)
MMKMNKLKFMVGSFLTLLMLGSVAPVVQADVVTAKVNSDAAALVDVQTGQVITEKNGSKRLPIASITKLLTVYLVEQQIAAGKLTMETKVKVPASIVAISQEADLANVPLSATQEYTVKELVEMALIRSANAAALELGYVVSGSETGANKMISELLASWNIKDVTIVSAAGLQNGDMGTLKNTQLSDETENELSPRELAIVARHLLKDFPQITDITSMKEATVTGADGNPVTITTSTRLLYPEYSHGYTFKGLKLGATPSIDYEFLGLTTLKGREVITVVQGTEHMWSDTIALLNQAKSDMKVVQVKKGEVVGKATVSGSNKKTVKVTADQAIGFFVPKSTGADITVKKASATAPLKAGAKLGNVVVSQKGVTDFVEGVPKIGVSAKFSVETQSWFDRLLAFF